MRNGLGFTTRKARHASLARSVFPRSGAAAAPPAPAPPTASWAYPVPPDDATVRGRLGARGAELTEMLQAFTGRQEGGGKRSVEPPAGAPRDGSAAMSASGQDRLPRQEWRWVTAEAWAEKIGQALSAIA